MNAQKTTAAIGFAIFVFVGLIGLLMATQKSSLEKNAVEGNRAIVQKAEEERRRIAKAHRDSCMRDKDNLERKEREQFPTARSQHCFLNIPLWGPYSEYKGLRQRCADKGVELPPNPNGRTIQDALAAKERICSTRWWKN